MLRVSLLLLLAAAINEQQPASGRQQEVVAFRSVSYGCSHGNGCIQRSYLQYNYSAITAVISFTATNLTQLTARAHKFHVRVIHGVRFGEHLGTCTQLYSCTRLLSMELRRALQNQNVILCWCFDGTGPSERFDASRLADRNYTSTWSSAVVQQVLAFGGDGFNLDVEHFHNSSVETPQ